MINLKAQYWGLAGGMERVLDVMKAHPNQQANSSWKIALRV